MTKREVVFAADVALGDRIVLHSTPAGLVGGSVCSTRRLPCAGADSDYIEIVVRLGRLHFARGMCRRYYAGEERVAAVVSWDQPIWRLVDGG